MTNPDPKSQAVMHIERGEELAGMWATPQMPQIGVYKLIAKKRADGKFEWVHFQHRQDGTRKVLFRGELESRARIAEVVDATNRTLTRVYGVVMQVADFDRKTLDGRKTDGTVHEQLLAPLDSLVIARDQDERGNLVVEYNIASSLRASLGQNVCWSSV